MGDVSDETKADARARIRAVRRARSDAERQAAAAALAAHAHALLPDDPAPVAAYLSLPEEPGTAPLLHAVTAAGRAVVVPRVAGPGALEWVVWAPGASTRPGAFGIEEPQGAGAARLPVGVAVVFVPALAVDRTGRRLGQGGGFYDRALAALPTHADGGPLRVACLFDGEVLDTVPHEPHDARVDVALTPSGTVALG